MMRHLRNATPSSYRLIALVILVVAAGIWYAGSWTPTDPLSESAESMIEMLQSTPAPIDEEDELLALVQEEIDQSVNEALSDNLVRQIVPPHPWYQSLVDTVAGETATQLVAHLHHMDDVILAGSSIGDTGGLFCMEGTIPFVERLHRVRRLLELSSSERSTILPLLMDDFRNIVEAWPDTFLDEAEYAKELGKRLEAMSETQRKAHYQKVQEELASKSRNDTPPDVRYRDRGAAVAYLLTELQAYEVLPLMLRDARVHDPFPSETPWKERRSFRPHSLVPPGLTLQMMRRLIASYPPQGLDKDAATAREIFLTAATAELADPEMRTVTRWDAQYNESDPRMMFLDGIPFGRERLLAEEPTFEMPHYHLQFRDGGELQSFVTLQPRTRELLDLAAVFIESAFPGDPALEPRTVLERPFEPVF